MWKRATKVIHGMERGPMRQAERAGAAQPGGGKALGRPESGLSVSKGGL